jgi:hypothetical protein
MDGKILNSEGEYIAFIRANAIYDLSGKRLYDLKAIISTNLPGGTRGAS